MTAQKFTEPLVAKELERLEITPSDVGHGAVRFEGTLRDAYRAIMFSRVASRLLLVVGEADATTADSLYDGVYALKWEEHLPLDHTFAVELAGGNEEIRHTRFGALKVKDAIVDRLRAHKGRRPDVDTERPDVRIHAHVRGAQAFLSVDLSGPMHERGYRPKGAEAPLRETLAAAVLMFAGWPERAREKGAVLVDPMCGSGTLLVEAALMALDVAPGLLRPRLQADRWPGHDDRAWAEVFDEARAFRAAGARTGARIFGSDRSAEAVALAEGAISRVGATNIASVKVLDVAALTAPEGSARGLVVTNPPYGERLGDEAEHGPLYERLGDVLRHAFPGWNAWVLASSPALIKHVGLKAGEKIPLMNGPIECRLIHYAIKDAAPTGADPHWKKPSPESEMFGNRLQKNWKNVSKRAARDNIDAFRVYDTDIPEYNVVVDWYAGKVRVEEFEAPRFIPRDVADKRRTDILRWIPKVLGVSDTDVVLRVRARRSDGEQHEKRGSGGQTFTVNEGDMRFEVNLEDYLDTGLFLDDRALRARIRELSSGKTFLNLFAYTCSASVAAAKGGATETTSVDLSRTYLAWGERNFALNGIAANAHRFIHSDALEFVARDEDRYDVIFVAPPTYSRSKRTDREFDVQLDHPWLIERGMSRLTEDGVLLFTTNLRRFEMEPRVTSRFGVKEITEEMTPFDFKKGTPFRAFEIQQAR
jgi:23S rRNA (guanine2445-N2)-methyltransferase / 23S rRNA (guanine2069-N7)-methyltransferase